MAMIHKQQQRPLKKHMLQCCWSMSMQNIKNKNKNKEEDEKNVLELISH